MSDVNTEVPISDDANEDPVVTLVLPIVCKTPFLYQAISKSLSPVLLNKKFTIVPPDNASCVPKTVDDDWDVADNGNVPVTALNPIPDAVVKGASIKVIEFDITLALFAMVTLNVRVPKLEGVGVCVLVGVIVGVCVLVGVLVVVGVTWGVSVGVWVWVCVGVGVTLQKELYPRVAPVEHPTPQSLFTK